MKFKFDPNSMMFSSPNSLNIFWRLLQLKIWIAYNPLIEPASKKVLNLTLIWGYYWSMILSLSHFWLTILLKICKLFSFQVKNQILRSFSLKISKLTAHLQTLLEILKLLWKIATFSTLPGWHYKRPPDYSVKKTTYCGFEK